MHDPRLYLLLAELLANFVNDIPGTFDGECSSRLERGLPAGEAQGRDRGSTRHVLHKGPLVLAQSLRA